MGRKLAPVSPGEMLSKEFLEPLGMSNYRLAREIGVPAQRIGEIIAGRRVVTADTDLRLCRFFGLSDGWWLRLQVDYDTAIARASMAKVLAKIVPWDRSAAQLAGEWHTTVSAERTKSERTAVLRERLRATLQRGSAKRLARLGGSEAQLGPVRRRRPRSA